MMNWLRTYVFRFEVFVICGVLMVIGVGVLDIAGKLPGGHGERRMRYEEQIQCNGGYAFVRKTDGKVYPVTSRNGAATPCNN